MPQDTAEGHGVPLPPSTTSGAQHENARHHPHLHRGREHRRRARQGPWCGTRGGHPGGRRRQPGRHRRPGTGRRRGARPGRRPGPPGKGRAGRRLPRRVQARVRQRLRRRGADGRRPVAPARPPAGPAGRGRQGCGHRHRVPLRQGWRHRQLALRPQAAVALGQHLRLGAAGARGARCDRRLPGLPGRHPRARRDERHQGDRLRVPARAVVPRPPPRCPHRRGTHHVQRPRAWRVEDVGRPESPG